MQIHYERAFGRPNDRILRSRRWTGRILGWGSILIVSFMIITVINGCGFIAGTRIEMLNEKETEAFFGNYYLGFGGGGSNYSDYSAFSIHVTCVKELGDTTDIPETPVFIIDSVCLSADCIQPGNCYIPITYRESGRVSMMRGLGRYEEPEENEDLFVRYKGSISPTGYSVYDGVYLPLRCKNKEVRATVFARLLERASKSEIARESRVYTLYVKNEGVCVTCDN